MTRLVDPTGLPVSSGDTPAPLTGQATIKSTAVYQPALGVGAVKVAVTVSGEQGQELHAALISELESCPRELRGDDGDERTVLDADDESDGSEVYRLVPEQLYDVVLAALRAIQRDDTTRGAKSLVAILPPKQAMATGLGMIVTAERAVGEAMGMAMLMELGGLQPSEAVATLQSVSETVRGKQEIVSRVAGGSRMGPERPEGSQPS